MQSDISLETILKAISNKKRLEIFDYITKEEFLIKTELITHFGLQRAGLDFHLTALEEAGLIGLLEIKIKGRKYVFIFPKATLRIDLDLLETSSLQDFFPSKLLEDDFSNFTEQFWVESSAIKDPQTIKKILEKLVSKLGKDSSEYYCQRCKNEPGIMKCSECLKLFCTECAKIIEKKDDAKITLCYDCIEDQFS
ncbi:MAG: helix-turn-helix domain-containing protein [Candidatus Heimdallarchaeota archaeon]|nr:MAG: helix-turn-helix domain-containing protein [Candidatus Heimdallarchaeota archaeon]